MSEPANYLALEGDIEAQLRAELVTERDVARAVYTASQLPELTETTIQLPAVGLHLRRERIQNPSGQADDGWEHAVTQEWQATVLVSNKGDSQRARDQAGPLITATIQALAAYRPRQTAAPLRRVEAPAPRYEPRLLIWPLVFETTFAMQGATP